MILSEELKKRNQTNQNQNCDSGKKITKWMSGVVLFFPISGAPILHVHSSQFHTS